MDITICVAIAGVVVACGSLGWQVYNTLVRDRPKIKVNYTKGYKPFKNELARFCINVTNVGRRPITIEEVGVKYVNNEVFLLPYGEGENVLTEKNPRLYCSIEEEKLNLDAIKYVFAKDFNGKIYKTRFKNKEQE